MAQERYSNGQEHGNIQALVELERTGDFQPEITYEDNGIVLATGTAHPQLARDIAKHLGHSLDEPISHFGDGETDVVHGVNLRRRHLIIIQPTVPPNVNDHWMEIFFMGDAAMRASADEVTAVVPYYGYARGDKKDRPRSGIPGSHVARLAEASSIDRLMTVEIHAEQTVGSFRRPWDNLYVDGLMLDHLAQEGYDLPDLSYGSPDFGGVRRAHRAGNRGNSPDRTIAFKARDLFTKDESKTYGLLGEVAGKDVVLWDDVSSSAKTLTDAAHIAMEKGADSVIAAVAHGVFADDDALIRIEQSPLEKVLTTDSLPHRKAVLQCPKIEVVSIAPLLADAIARNQTGESVSELFAPTKPTEPVHHIDKPLIL